MTDVKITDPVLIRTFKGTGEPLAVCGPDGRVLGYFTPAKESLRHLEPLISEEELTRRENDRTSKTHTAAEVEAKMKEWRCSQ